MNTDTNEPEPESENEISKSQRKRDADDIRDFVARLVLEKKQKLNKLPLSAEIRDAIANCPAQSTRGAYKRHIQYISKLIRKTGEFETLKTLLDSPPTAKINPHETLCNQLIESFSDHADTLREQYPTISMQQARQLARAAQPITYAIENEPTDQERIAAKKITKARKSLLRLLSEATHQAD